MRTISVFALCACLLLPSAAKAELEGLTEEALLGHWSLDGITDGRCLDHQTLSFYESGAFLVLRRDNERVAVLGTWVLTDEGVAIRANDFGNPGNLEAGMLGVVVAEADHIELLEGEDRRWTLDRCTF